MTSIQATLSQRKTNNFVVTAIYTDLNNLLSNCYLLSEAHLEQWYQDNKAKIIKNGSLYTIGLADYKNLVSADAGGIWSYPYYTSLPDEGYVPVGTTLTDLGKDVYIGIPGQANILHYRLVQAPGALEAYGNGGIVGYTPVEANAQFFQYSTPQIGIGVEYPCISVARI